VNPDHVDDPVTGFGDRVQAAGEHGAGSVLSIDCVGLAPQPTVSPVRTDGLQDPDTAAADRRGESGLI